MKPSELLQRGWVRGLIFGTLVGLALGLSSLLMSSGASQGVGTTRTGGAPELGGALTMGPGGGGMGGGGGPVLPEREAALLQVAREWASRGIPEKVEAIVAELEPGPGRDAVLGELIDAKIAAPTRREERSGGKGNEWIAGLQKDVERMGTSTEKVSRLIQLSQLQRQLENGPGLAAPGGFGAPADAEPKDNPRADALLQRAQEVAKSISTGERDWGGVALRVVLLGVACGLLGLVAGALVRPAKHNE